VESAFLVAGSGELLLVSPEGSVEATRCAAVGSGRDPAAAELFARYRDDMSVEEAQELVRDAVQRGIREDLGSGSSVHVWTLPADEEAPIERRFFEDVGSGF